MNNTSIITLNQEALASNIAFIRTRLKEGVIFSSVVKGNAYGHGIDAVVPLFERCGMKHFSVFSAKEAFQVFHAMKGEGTVMVMGEIHDDDLPWVIQNHIEFFVFDMERMRQAITCSRKVKEKALIHLEVETGLNRTGFDKDQIPALITLLKENRNYLSIQGICTHYAGAESIANHVRVKKQISRFNKFCAKLEGEGIDTGLKHTACSAAAMAYPKTQMDMVRIGILQYGFWPSKEILIDYLNKCKVESKADPLIRVITWNSYIMTTKQVKTGDFIGYGTSYLAQQDMLIGVVPVGYANGYGRVLSNQGRVLVNGRRVGVVGVVNMNMIMIDLTDVPDVSRGTEVILIGNQDNVDVSVASFSELSNQLNYELLTRLPHDIPRITK